MINSAYLRKGIILEYVTVGWNVTSVLVLGLIAPTTHAVALFGFGLFTLIEIGPSLVVIWKLRDHARAMRRLTLRIVSIAFLALGMYLIFQNNWNLIYRIMPVKSLAAVTWVGLTFIIMGLSALKKDHFGQKLHNDILLKSGRSALIHAALAVMVFLSMPSLWQFGYAVPDVIAGFILMAYCFYECWQTWIAAKNEITNV